MSHGCPGLPATNRGSTKKPAGEEGGEKGREFLDWGLRRYCNYHTRMHRVVTGALKYNRYNFVEAVRYPGLFVGPEEGVGVSAPT